MTFMFLVWTTGWVVVPLTEAENTEQEASPLPHSSPTLCAIPCGSTVGAPNKTVFI